MLELRTSTPIEWVQAVQQDVVAFLRDHAHNERKVATTALVLAAQNAQRDELVSAMIDIAREELAHFKQVHDLLLERGVSLGYDRPDPYAGPMRNLIRKHPADDYLLDRLLVCAVIEARGCERFQLLAEHLADPNLKTFYLRLSQAEERHKGIFLELAERYFRRSILRDRLTELLEAEAQIVAGLELRAALH